MMKNARKINRKKDLLKNLLFSVCVFILFILILLIAYEVFLRTLLIYHEWKYDDKSLNFTNVTLVIKSETPGLYFEFDKDKCKEIKKGVTACTNSYGFLGKNISLIKPNNTRRIIVLGDSVTASQVVLGDDAYPTKLENMLNEYNTTEYEVLNFGVHGYGIEQYYITYKTKAEQFDPDYLVVGYVLNDPTINQIPELYTDNKSLSCKISQFDLLIPCGLKNILTKSEALNSIYVIISNIRTTLTGNDYYRMLHTTDYGNVETYLSKLGNESMAKHKILVIFPLLYQLDDYHWEDIHVRVSETAKKEGFIIIDLLPYYQQYKESELKGAWNDIIHPDKLGHAIAAEQIYSKIIELENGK